MMLGPLFLLCFVTSSWAAQICCVDIGCFTDDPPFQNLPLPWCEELIHPTYTLYTRANPIVGEAFDHVTVPGFFKRGARTAFLIHGSQNSGSWMITMKDALLNREDINVAVVNWEAGSDDIVYNQAASNTRSTGAYTALVIDNLVSSAGGSYGLMWCVGHSLGAHVCGHAGMTTTLARITGLDPAGPSFENSPDLTIGLNPTCAILVDVIHTDTTTYGTLRELGHIDFYPAAGRDQPGCTGDIARCSHARAVTYMEESVRQDCFESTQSCTDYTNIPGSCSRCTCGLLDPCALMGYATDQGCATTGTFYLDIIDTVPYCDILEDQAKKTTL